ncbi:16S rRNA (cytosine(967)-C(5))-methyltransferase RsmB [Facklamia sp. DSM 111018]|uniref:16S rRNA (cytosine(967)-C(5))-methyltransferase n=1 Tax=Facklamia lactis TaxID=2749967 RepID=A0ABS0LN99_9LACT|nr:16S rRNA (cytosine(967)-C(5))-methyltransferase RsmB [Facklamia lactis]MBG9979796.1 16S rRNA (cytosine(967)-C(5))-methyltransferase RsmB [Facklamia lactis]MBG9985524.1 16S rRNA (cytosine(967)-C(5))-methyltransferase RsmB [Facklamia lactis]
MKIKNKSKRLLKNNLRWDMLILLDQIDHHGEYSNHVIDQFMVESPKSLQDRNLIVKVVYGSVQRRMTLDYYLKDLLEDKTVEDWIQSLLRLSVYQLVYLDRIPEHAVVHEAVEIAKINGHQGLAKFVNAILRQFLRKKLPSFDQITDLYERLSIKYSIQKWMVEYFSQFLELEQLEEFLSSLNNQSYLSARLTLPKEQREELVQALMEEGFQVEKSSVAPEGIRSTNRNLIHSTAFQQGKLTIQDESSMLVAPLGLIQGDEEVLDACAAPGGKATHIASLLSEGHLTALDISARKLKILADHAERMGLSDRISLKAMDALKFEGLSQKLFDVIYLDAPCSGLGLMRRKPEIKYVKTMADIQSLSRIQSDLLNHLSTLLKPGGYLIYSTCTLSVEENENKIESFVEEHTHFEVDEINPEEILDDSLITDKGYIRIWPHDHGTDGFFICRLKKIQ